MNRAHGSHPTKTTSTENLSRIGGLRPRTSFQNGRAILLYEIYKIPRVESSRVKEKIQYFESLETESSRSSYLRQELKFDTYSSNSNRRYDADVGGISESKNYTQLSKSSFDLSDRNNRQLYEETLPNKNFSSFENGLKNSRSESFHQTKKEYFDHSDQQQEFKFHKYSSNSNIRYDADGGISKFKNDRELSKSSLDLSSRNNRQLYEESSINNNDSTSRISSASRSSSFHQNRNSEYLNETLPNNFNSFRKTLSFYQTKKEDSDHSDRVICLPELFVLLQQQELNFDRYSSNSNIRYDADVGDISKFKNNAELSKSSFDLSDRNNRQLYGEPSRNKNVATSRSSSFHQNCRNSEYLNQTLPKKNFSSFQNGLKTSRPASFYQSKKEDSEHSNQNYKYLGTLRNPTVDTRSLSYSQKRGEYADYKATTSSFMETRKINSRHSTAFEHSLETSLSKESKNELNSKNIRLVEDVARRPSVQPRHIKSKQSDQPRTSLQGTNLTKINQDRNGDNMFKKRKGVTNKGHEFEDYLTALIALRLTADPEVENFNLSANDDFYEGMDDIVFQLKTAEGLKKYAMQLKHSSRKDQMLTRNSLSGKKNQTEQKDGGNFNIMKYFKQYQNVREKSKDDFKFILCTNSKFSLCTRKNQNGNKLDTLYVEDGEVTIKLQIIEMELDIEQLKFRQNDGKECKCYFFKIDDSEMIDDPEKYQDFFENFIFLPNYMPLEELQLQLEVEFKKIFGHEGTAHSGYFDYIKGWSAREGKKVMLNKTLVKEVISLELVSPHVRTIQHFEDELTENDKLFKEAVSHFKITVIHPKQERKLYKFWGNKEELPEIETLHKELFKYDLIPSKIKTIEDVNKDLLTKGLWLMRKIPLVVNDHEDVQATVEICENLNLKFVILSDKDIPRPGMFQNLDELKNLDENLYQKIIKTFKYVLQEKPIQLARLIDLIKSRNVAELITPNQLLRLADNSLNLDNEIKDLPPAYIERFLSRNIINFEFLRNIEDEILILISCCPKENGLKNFDANFKILTIEDVKKETYKILNRSPKTIFVSETKCDKDDLDKFCLEQNIKYHHFKLFENNKLEWIRSNCDVSELKKFYIEGYYFPESEIIDYETENIINIICDEPGIGKTSLMKNIQFKNSTQIVWTVLIHVKNHSLHFQSNQDGDVKKFQEYLLEEVNSQITDFEKEVLKWVMEKKFVRYIWDGLDELSERSLRAVTILIDKLSKNGSKQWLNSRTNLRNSLEQQHNVIARSIKKFEKKDQDEYLEKRLQNVSSKSFNKEHIKTKFLKHEFLEIPLQIFILTELLLQNVKKYSSLLEEPFTVPDLYMHFIDAKFEFYFKTKLGFKYEKNDARFMKFSRDKEDQICNYEQVAALTYFQDIVPDSTRILAENFLKRLGRNHDEYGIVTTVGDNTAEFFHSSFGEYFAVSYLIKNIDDFSLLKEKIFYRDNILYLFNVIMSRSHKVHKAVMTRNFKMLKKCTVEELKVKDKVGRHALHLAFANGTKYPVMRVENNTVDDRQVYWQDLKAEPSEYVDALKLLLKTCNPNDYDKFSLNCFLYAYNNNYFYILAMLDETLHIFENDTEKYYSVLYYCVRFDYDTIFEKMEIVPLIKSKHFNKSLLYVAVHYNSFKCLEKILTNPRNSHYREIVEANEEELLTLALEKGMDKVVGVLCTNGAPLNNKTSRAYERRISRNSKRFKTVGGLDDF